MPQEVIRQRIKYLVEHGELYPQQEMRIHDKRMQYAVIALLAFNLLETTLLFGRYILH